MRGALLLRNQDDPLPDLLEVFFWKALVDSVGALGGFKESNAIFGEVLDEEVMGSFGVGD
jgi:hypothetical protein